MKLATVLPFFLFLFGYISIVDGQEDCFVNTDQLEPPLQADTTRVIDSEPPYNETIYILRIYDGKIVYDTTRVIDPKTYEEQLYVNTQYSARHIKPDHISVCGPKSYFFKQKGNCLQLYQIKEKHELNKVNR